VRQPAPRRSLWRVATLLPIGAALWALGLLLLDAENGLSSFFAIRHDVTEAQRELAALVAERDALASEVQALQVDAFEIERRAREDLGMLRPGERMLRWAPPSP
jgi:cell division protein FtsB